VPLDAEAERDETSEAVVVVLRRSATASACWWWSEVRRKTTRMSGRSNRVTARWEHLPPLAKSLPTSDTIPK
jgi:hypothetical protein